MTARRILAGSALLLAAFTTAACAQIIPGTGTVAAGVQGGSQITDSPTASPSSTDDSYSSSTPDSSSSSSSSSPSSGSDDPSPVCQALSKSAVEGLFKTTVSFGRSSSSGCQIQAADGRSMIIAVFDYLKLSEYKKADTTDLTVAGHPAVKTSTTIIYVSRGSTADTDGLVAAYYASLRDGGDAIAAKVLEMVVPKFAK
jgi:ABC-type phosphate transport system substrate-binding protein